MLKTNPDWEVETFTNEFLENANKYIRTILYFLWLNTAFYFKTLFNKPDIVLCPKHIMPFCKVRGVKYHVGDITKLKVDAIVNAANSKLLGCFIPLHNCIDNIIHSSAGIQLRRECSKIMQKQGHDEEVGKAKITNAYNLPSKYVIHTVGPAIPYGANPSGQDCEKLASCYRSCLELASQNGLESIAFCSISTGVFNFPQRKAAKIAIKTVEDYLNENETSLEKVIFDVFSDDSYLIYKNLLFGG